MQKSIIIEGFDQPIQLARRKGTRNIRIAIKSDGKVRLTIPYGVPEFAAKKYLKSKVDWINKNIKPPTIILDNSHIGKSHRLKILPSNATRHSTKVTATGVFVNLPYTIDTSSPEGQKIIKKACDKALLQEASVLLPQRLEQLSKETQIEYRGCTIKKLKSRWGACDSHKNISLNSYLIQLDWSLIDYVIYHELAHINHPHHKSEFWNLVSVLEPNYKVLRKELKSKPTDIDPTNF